MLGWRLLISVILVPSLVTLFWLDAAQGTSAWILLGFCLLAAARNAFELHGLLTVRQLQPALWLTMTCSLLVILAAWLHPGLQQPAGPATLLTSLGWITAAMTLAFLVLLVHEAVAFTEPGRSMESLGSNLLTLAYGAGLLAVTAQLRWFPSADLGYFAIGSLIITVKCGDIGAYTFGRLWGKRKMAPRLSPGKTWMGLNGAVVGSVLGGWLWLSFAGQLFAARPLPTSLMAVLSYSAVLGLAGLTGDLCESLIKRDVQKKDAAALMPGFGGLLDLLDSPLFAGPVALAWWQLLPPAASSLP